MCECCLADSVAHSVEAELACKVQHRTKDNPFIPSPSLVASLPYSKTTSRCPWRGWDPWDTPPLTIVQQVKDWTAVAGSQTGHRLGQDARVIVKGGWVMNWNRRSNRTDTDFSGQQGRDKHNGWTGEKRDLQVTGRKTVERLWKQNG